jgi:hypothetical protein
LAYMSSLQTYNIFPYDSISRRVSPESDNTGYYAGSSASDHNSIASSLSSVVPTGPASVGPPKFVPRVEGDVLSKYDKPSIMRDTPPIHMRYRRKGERG